MAQETRKQGSEMVRHGLLILSVCVMALASCGGRERTTVTTTVRTTPAAAMAGGVGGVSASGNTASGNTASGKTAAKVAPTTSPAAQPAAQPAVQPAASLSGKPQRKDRQSDFGKILLGGAVAGSIIAGANDPGLAVGRSVNPNLAAASGAQCSNPFGGENAGNGQSICSEQGEKLQCQCSDGSCQLVQTGMPACTPTGAVVN